MSDRRDRSMMTSFPALATGVAALVLLLLAVWRWREIGWGALIVPAFAAMWFIRVPNEEALMRRRFGAEWDAYCARAGRLWPRRAA